MRILAWFPIRYIFDKYIQHREKKRALIKEAVVKNMIPVKNSSTTAMRYATLSESFRTNSWLPMVAHCVDLLMKTNEPITTKSVRDFLILIWDVPERDATKIVKWAQSQGHLETKKETS